MVLQIPELESSRRSPSLARLRFAYSEALKQAKRHQEADSWRSRAIAEDPDGVAGVNELDDDEELEVIDLEWVDGEDGAPGEESPAAAVAVDDDQDDDDDADDDDDQDDDADDDDAVDDNVDVDDAGVNVDAGEVDDLADDEDDDLADDADDDDDADDVDDLADDEDLDDDEDDDEDDEDDAEGRAKNPTTAGDPDELEVGPAAKSSGVKGSAFEVRFEHGGREDADRSADRPE